MTQLSHCSLKKRRFSCGYLSIPSIARSSLQVQATFRLTFNASFAFPSNKVETRLLALIV